MLAASVALFLLLAPQEKDKGPKELETVRYREFADVVGEIAKTAEEGEKGRVVWLVDNASMLKASKHGELLAEAIERTFTKVGVTHSVVVFAETPRVALKSGDAAKAAAAISSIANAAPDDAVKNALGTVREAAKLAGGGKERKLLVLFTQDNSDNEDDVEATVKALKGAGVAFFPVVREAIYSDAYWEKAFAGQVYFPGGGVEKFRKLPFKLRGADGPYVEYPYGFPFEWMDPAGSVPSGFAPWAISRVAAQTGGKVYLYGVDRSVTSFCSRWGCPLCGGEHKACSPEFDVTKLKLTEPSLLSRAEHGTKAAKDRLSATILSAWERLYREGILEGAPPVKQGGSGLVEVERSEKDPRPAGLLRSTDWKVQHAQALKFADSSEKAANDLLEAAKRAEKTSEKRVLAAAESFGVQLKLLSQSFRQLALFCEGMEKAARVKKPASDGVAGSELESPEGEKVLAWYWRTYSLCHGGAPLKEAKFLGDPKGLHAALELADQMIEKHGGTPWELLLRRSSVPVFLPIFDQKSGAGGAARETPRPSARSSSGQATTETPGSPQRPSRGGSVDPGSRGSGTGTGGGKP